MWLNKEKENKRIFSFSFYCFSLLFRYFFIVIKSFHVRYMPITRSESFRKNSFSSSFKFNFLPFLLASQRGYFIIRIRFSRISHYCRTQTHNRKLIKESLVRKWMEVLTIFDLHNFSLFFYCLSIKLHYYEIRK